MLNIVCKNTNLHFALGELWGFLHFFKGVAHDSYKHVQGSHLCEEGSSDEEYVDQKLLVSRKRVIVHAKLSESKHPLIDEDINEPSIKILGNDRITFFTIMA